MSLTVFALALSIATAPVLATADLSSLQWKKRVFLLYADEGDRRYSEQLVLLEAVRNGLAERDMLVLAVTGQSVATLFGDASDLGVNAMHKTAGDDGAKSFEAVLIGKDGGVKQRWTTPVNPKALFEIIDAMPMRASEMRR